MPTPLEFKYPFIRIPFTVLAGNSSPTQFINMGNFTPVAMIFPAGWDAEPMTFTFYTDLGSGNYAGGQAQQPNGDPFLVNTTAGYLPLDQTIFGTTTIFNFTSSSVNQSADRRGYVIGAPLYTNNF